MMIVTWFMTADRIKTLTTKYILSFVGMMLYIYLIIKVASCNYYTPTPNTSPNLVTGAVVTWFRVEMLTWFGLILSNMIFLLIRSCIKHKVDSSIYIDEGKKLPQIDTIMALESVANYFHAELVPCFIATVLFASPNGRYDWGVNL